MRSEKEMLDLIIDIANNDVRIRAAYLEGSRANPNVPKDLFQDYDVIYVVMETKSFREDKEWINRFGKRLCNIQRKIYTILLMLKIVMGG